MKMQALLSAVWGVGLLLTLNGARMGSARHNWHAPQALFIFGDSFVDTGNLPPPDSWTENTRQWYYPYGFSNEEVTAAQEKAGQDKVTGRFSDFMVQSDFIDCLVIAAKILGLHLSPPTVQSTHGDSSSPSGMNFAFGITGVFDVSTWTNLRGQVDFFKRMIKSGSISKNHVTHSVALISTSANDYKHFGTRRNSSDNTEFIRNVTTEIAANVERLRNLGVKRILVNNLHPLGCTPALCRARHYKVCDYASNQDASEHNTNLAQKLGSMKGVFIVNLHSAFSNIISDNKFEDSESSSYKQFKHTRKPCCEANHPKGFCGQDDENSDEPLYSLCADPSKYFFWDDEHPTQAGWKSAMKQLEEPIKDFLGIV